MSQPGRIGKYLLVLALMVLIISVFALTRFFGPRIGNTFSSISNCLPDVGQTCLITPTFGDVSSTEFPSATEDSSSSSPIEQLERVDQALRQSIQSSIAYNVPSRMTLDGTVTLELLLNPSLSPTELAGQIDQSGEITTTTIEITPMMKAELIPQDTQALMVQPIHADAVQLVGSAETTRWSWLVTARKRGPQKLVLVIHRLVKFDGQEFWREVSAYQAEINVDVTLGQRLQSAGWAWGTGLVLAALLLGALWRVFASRSQSTLGRGRSNRRGKKQGHIFISYRRADSADIAGRIYDRLVEEFGRSLIFKDVDSIPLGSDFKQTLDQKVSECVALLAIIGDGWTGESTGQGRLADPQDFVRVEVESALARGIPVIPLLVRGAQMPRSEDLPPGLQPLVHRNGIPIRPDPDFHRDMERLIAALDQFLR